MWDTDFRILLAIFLCLRGALCDECEPSLTTVSGTKANLQITGDTICSGQLIFEDNFGTFDLDTWHHDVTLTGGGNGEFQMYVNNRSNSYIDDSGHLHIKPTLLADDYGNDFLYSGTLDLGESCTAAKNSSSCVRTGTADQILDPIKSAKITTSGKFAFKYGKIEVSAKVPVGDWFWPAIWLMPQNSTYGGWPASGEVDIMESRGNRNLTNSAGVNIGHEQAGSSLLWGPNWQHVTGTHFPVQNSSGFDSGFFRYQMEWSPEKIVFLVDDISIGTFNAPENGMWKHSNFDQTGLENPWVNASNLAPFDLEFYIIINIAVGGTHGYFPESATNEGGKPWANNSPRAMAQFWEGREQWLPTWNMDTDDSHMQIDYVKVWAL